MPLRSNPTRMSISNAGHSKTAKRFPWAVLLLVTVAAMAVLVPQAAAECCGSGTCANGLETGSILPGLGDAFDVINGDKKCCGRGDCNAFCCNCDDGCISADDPIERWQTFHG